MWSGPGRLICAALRLYGADRGAVVTIVAALERCLDAWPLLERLQIGRDAYQERLSAPREHLPAYWGVADVRLRDALLRLSGIPALAALDGGPAVCGEPAMLARLAAALTPASVKADTTVTPSEV